MRRKQKRNFYNKRQKNYRDQNIPQVGNQRKHLPSKKMTTDKNLLISMLIRPGRTYGNYSWKAS